MNNYPTHSKTSNLPRTQSWYFMPLIIFGMNIPIVNTNKFLQSSDINEYDPIFQQYVHLFKEKFSIFPSAEKQKFIKYYNSNIDGLNHIRGKAQEVILQKIFNKDYFTINQLVFEKWQQCCRSDQSVPPMADFDQQTRQNIEKFKNDPGLKLINHMSNPKLTDSIINKLIQDAQGNVNVAIERFFEYGLPSKYKGGRNNRKKQKRKKTIKKRKRKTNKRHKRRRTRRS